jgi:hypothetical protein
MSVLATDVFYTDKYMIIFSWSVDGVRPHEHRLHEPADEGAGGPHHQPQEALQASAQPSHQQVGSSVTSS